MTHLSFSDLIEGRKGSLRCDHLKLTAAIATCMYLESNGEVKGYDESQYAFALVAGDARAIGRFINRSLRPRDLSARSELVRRATHAVERLVEEELGRECLLFAGGGNFLFLAPPSKLEDLTGKAKDLFEREAGGELCVTVESVVCNGRDLMSFGERWRDARAKVGRRRAVEAAASAWEIDVESEPWWVCGVRPADKIDVDIPDYMQPFDANTRPDAVCSFCYAQRRQPYSRRVSVEEVKDERDYIGVLKMDGDSVGELFSEGLKRLNREGGKPEYLISFIRYQCGRGFLDWELGEKYGTLHLSSVVFEERIETIWTLGQLC